MTGYGAGEKGIPASWNADVYSELFRNDPPVTATIIRGVPLPDNSLF